MDLLAVPVGSLPPGCRGHWRVWLLNLLLRWLAGLTLLLERAKLTHSVGTCHSSPGSSSVLGRPGVPGCDPFAVDCTRTRSLTDGVIPQTGSGSSVTELQAHCVRSSGHQDAVPVHCLVS